MSDKKAPLKGNAKDQAKDAQARADMFVAAQKWSTIRLGSVEGAYVICVIALVIGAVEAVRALSGKQTDAEFILGILGGKSVSNAFGAVAGTGGLIWGHRERRMRKKVIEEKHQRIAELELLIHPDRTSAALSLGGDTLPEHR